LALRMGDISKETPIFKSKYTQTTPRRWSNPRFPLSARRFDILTAVTVKIFVIDANRKLLRDLTTWRHIANDKILTSTLF
jgi:hypothetical protein